MNDEFMKIAVKEAKKALKIGEVPVGCIIVKNKEIIAKTYNTKEKNNNAFFHAEIKALLQTMKKMKNWRLDEYELYTTLEPCLMCMTAINECRIKKVYYCLENKNSSNYEQMFNKIQFVKCVKYENETKKLLELFFKNIREK